MSIMLAARPDTHFSSPEDRTATEPPELCGLRRDGVRLMIATAAGIQHTVFRSLADHLRAGDVLVVNTSATVPGQLDGDRNGSPVIVHVGNRLPDCSRVVELRSAPDASAPILDGRVGERIGLPAGCLLELIAAYPESGSSPTGLGNRLWRARITTRQRLSDYLREQARPISYGYLNASFPISAYQTIFALHPGSAEMPSAARPFTDRLVTDLATAGVLVVPVRLHTGVASFEADEPPYPERFVVPDTTARVVNEARAAGHRAIAVGTTSVRALESAVTEDGAVVATAGWTDLVITPERPVRAVDGLLTGFHEPRASHLRMLTAVVGTELIARCYAEAISSRLLWHEFGDTNLLLP